MKRKAFRLLGAPCQRSGRIRGVLRRLLQTTLVGFILKNFKVHANTMFRLPMNWKIRTPVSHRCTLKEGAPSSGELYEKLWLLCCPQSLFGLPVRDQLPAILEKHRRRVPISSATWWALCTMACSALQAEAKRTMENGVGCLLRNSPHANCIRRGWPSPHRMLPHGSRTR